MASRPSFASSSLYSLTFMMSLKLLTPANRPKILAAIRQTLMIVSNTFFMSFLHSFKHFSV